MNRKLILALTIGLFLPLLTGCFFLSGSSNPVGDTSVANAQKSAQALNTVKPQVMAAAYASPVDRRYTFAKSAHKIGYQFKEGVNKGPASLRLLLQTSEVSDSIFITFDKMTVKPEVGPKITINMPQTRVNLLSASTLAEVLAEQELPAGRYNFMEFSVADAEIEYENKLYPVTIPSKKIRFIGKYELKEGYSTRLTVKFIGRMQKFLKGKKHSFMMTPVVKIASDLVLNVSDEVTAGEVKGSIENFIDAANKLSGVNVSLMPAAGPSLSASTDSNGAFSFPEVPAGVYTLRAAHPDFLDYEFMVDVTAGQVADLVVQMNPAVVKSTVGNTGWFSQIYPLADANGEFSEVSLETPVNIDFISLAFVKAELEFTAVYHSIGGSARCQNYLASTQQVSADTNLGSWWVGNTANTGSFLGDFFATADPGTSYKVDVTDMIRSNPSSIYFMASRNFDIVDIKMSGIQLTIYYR